MIIRDSLSQIHVLITGGRAPVALDLARKFATAGHQVYVAESIRYHLCRVSRFVKKSFHVPKPNMDELAYRNALAQIIEQEQIDLLLPTCEEIFYIAKYKNWLEARTDCRVFTSDINCLRKLHNKWTFIKLVQQYGFRAPKTRLIESNAELFTVIQDSDFYDKVVLKPVYSRFAANVHILKMNHLQASLRKFSQDQQITSSQPWVMQQFISGQPYCTYSIAREGKLKAFAAYLPAYTAGRGAAIYFKPVQHQPLMEWVKHFVAHASFTGQISFDFIETNDGTIYPIECNPRTTSGIHLLPYNNALMEAMIGGHLDDEILRTPPSHPATMLLPAIFIYSYRLLPFPKRWFAWLSDVYKGKDVVFCTSDIGPFFEQFRIVWESWNTARKHRVSLTEATTLDIEWNGDS